MEVRGTNLEQMCTLAYYVIVLRCAQQLTYNTMQYNTTVQYS